MNHITYDKNILHDKLNSYGPLKACEMKQQFFMYNLCKTAILMQNKDYIIKM